MGGEDDLASTLAPKAALEVRDEGVNPHRQEDVLCLRDYLERAATGAISSLSGVWIGVTNIQAQTRKLGGATACQTFVSF